MMCLFFAYRSFEIPHNKSYSDLTSEKKYVKKNRRKQGKVCLKKTQFLRMILNLKTFSSKFLNILVKTFHK